MAVCFNAGGAGWFGGALRCFHCLTSFNSPLVKPSNKPSKRAMRSRRFVFPSILFTSWWSNEGDYSLFNLPVCIPL